jgi:retron-type reverse transcriptase
VKSFAGIFSRITPFASLHAAWLRARKGKRSNGDMLAFEADLEPNLFAIQESLLQRSYRTGPYRLFEIFEPKRRVVAALPIKDRIVQHALVAQIEPIWEARFDRHSYACRVGKGTHAGADQAQAMMRQVLRQNGRVAALKGDIARCFPSICHDVLKRLIRSHVACRDTLWLIDEIIDSAAEPGALLPRGIPIGNLSSQLFANICLDRLDRFVRQELHWRHYVRYMDDFMLLGSDKAALHEARRSIEGFLHAELGLRVNAKTQVFPIGGPRGRCLDFLGYRIWPTHRRLREGCVKRIRRRFKSLARRYHEGRVSLEEIEAVVASWLGHARHADAGRLVDMVLAELVLVPQRRRETCWISSSSEVEGRPRVAGRTRGQPSRS